MRQSDLVLPCAVLVASIVFAAMPVEAQVSEPLTSSSEMKIILEPAPVSIVGTIAPANFSHFTVTLRSVSRGAVPDADISVTGGGASPSTLGSSPCGIRPASPPITTASWCARS